MCRSGEGEGDRIGFPSASSDSTGDVIINACLDGHCARHLIRRLHRHTRAESFRAILRQLKVFQRLLLPPPHHHSHKRALRILSLAKSVTHVNASLLSAYPPANRHTQCVPSPAIKTRSTQYPSFTRSGRKNRCHIRISCAYRSPPGPPPPLHHSLKHFNAKCAAAANSRCFNACRQTCYYPALLATSMEQYFTRAWPPPATFPSQCCTSTGRCTCASRPTRQTSRYFSSTRPACACSGGRESSTY